MQAITEPLRAEHRTFLPEIERIRNTADGVGQVPVSQLREDLRGVEVFLTHELMPHALAEEAGLYPQVEWAMHAPGATKTMTRDHEEVEELVDELRATLQKMVQGAPTHHQERELRRILYGLYALLRLHFAKEEEIYLPLLDSTMSDQAAKPMFELMSHVAAAAGQREP